MPYIKQADRDRLLEGDLPSTPGELNYAFTVIALNYLRGNESYRTYNDILGALEGAKLELYRRYVVPYEDARRQENGDV